jgi:hypothetical protein
MVSSVGNGSAYEQAGSTAAAAYVAAACAAGEMAVHL